MSEDGGSGLRVKGASRFRVEGSGFSGDLLGVFRINFRRPQELALNLNPKTLPAPEHRLSQQP